MWSSALRGVLEAASEACNTCKWTKDKRHLTPDRWRCKRCHDILKYNEQGRDLLTVALDEKVVFSSLSDTSVGEVSKEMDQTSSVSECPAECFVLSAHIVVQLTLLTCLRILKVDLHSPSRSFSAGRTGLQIFYSKHSAHLLYKAGLVASGCEHVCAASQTSNCRLVETLHSKK